MEDHKADLEGKVLDVRREHQREKEQEEGYEWKWENIIMEALEAMEARWDVKLSEERTQKEQQRAEERQEREQQRAEERQVEQRLAEKQEN